MRKGVGELLLLAMLALPLRASGASLAPAGRWSLDPAATQCTLSHQFGDTSAGVTLGLGPGPLGQTFHLLIAVPRTTGIARSGKASIATSDAERTIASIPFTTEKLNETEDTVSIKVYGGADWFLAGATRLRVDLPEYAVEVELPRVDAALASLRTCHDALLTSWGVSEAERELAGSNEQKDRDFAIGNPADWISYRDYPQDALAKRQQGTSGILWTIGVDGRATDCRVVSSSGVPSLDAASCTAILSRARYRPVLGADGKPMIFHGWREVRWSIPS